jgi:hypothetical protein
MTLDDPHHGTQSGDNVVTSQWGRVIYFCESRFDGMYWHCLVNIF